MTSIIPGSSSSNRIFQGQRKDFIVMRKDTFEYTGTYSYMHTDGATVQYDFTDCVGMMMIKKKKTDTTAIKVIGVSFDEYEYTLTVDSIDMDIDAGKYFYDLQIYDTDSKMVTKLYGNFIVLQDVTDFEAVIEKEYSVLLKGSIESFVVPNEKITVLLSSTIVTELFQYAQSNYSVMFDSSISNSEAVSIIFTTKFNSTIEIIRQINPVFNTMFNSSIEITTYNNYENNIMFESSITNYSYLLGTDIVSTS